MYYYDWTWLLILPGLLLGMWAQFRIRSAYSKYGRVRVNSGLTADQVARDILNRSGNGDVTVGRIQGQLTDHFDPRNKSLCLSEGVYAVGSVAAIGIAAHECGHAIQAGSDYGPLKLRSAIVPVVNVGSRLYFPIFLAGMIFSWEPLMDAGIICFGLIFLFSLITLPVEFNASKRAITVLQEGNYVNPEELVGVKAVLSAAAMTYVASAISSLLQMVRLIVVSRSRRRD